MTQTYHASGWIPRVQNESAGRQQLQNWLNRSANWDRQTMPPSPWQYSVVIQPNAGILHPGTNQTPIYRDTTQKLFNYLRIPVNPGTYTTKGYVTCRRTHQSFGSLEQTERGAVGGVINPTLPPTVEFFEVWEVVRCMPETDQEALVWGFTHENRNQWETILRESRRYNLTLRERLIHGYSAPRAHNSAVTDMSRQSYELVMLAAFQLALNVGSSGGMNYAPGFGDFAQATFTY